MDVYSNASSCSADTSFIGNLITGEEVEDESLEWLSTYVEECLCDTTISYTTPLSCTTNISGSNNSSTPHGHNSQTTCPTKISSLSHDSELLPTKSRSKRRRITPKKFSLEMNNQYQNFLVNVASSSDPLLHHQTCWLAESELLLPQRKEDQTTENKAPEQQQQQLRVISGAVDDADDPDDDEQFENDTSLVHQLQRQHQQQPIRRCTHCLSHKTPQWRAGPLGPKTLCNACGVSYKKGRLLPEYRPAKSPTFVSYKHSNSYKKVMEMRMAVMASSGK